MFCGPYEGGGSQICSSGHTKTKTTGDIEWGPDPEASSGFLCGCYQQELVGQGNCFWEFHNMKIINNSTVRGTPFIPCFVVISSLSHVQLFWDPVDCSPPGSSVHGISQAWILEWSAISFSRGSSWPRNGTLVSCIDRQVLNHLATDGGWIPNWNSEKLWNPGQRYSHSASRKVEGY